MLRELNYIQGDEELMECALKSLRKIRRERNVNRHKMRRHT